jgi:hypothetical protein
MTSNCGNWYKLPWRILPITTTTTTMIHFLPEEEIKTLVRQAFSRTTAPRQGVISMLLVATTKRRRPSFVWSRKTHSIYLAFECGSSSEVILPMMLMMLMLIRRVLLLLSRQVSRVDKNCKWYCVKWNWTWATFRRRYYHRWMATAALSLWYRETFVGSIDFGTYPSKGTNSNHYTFIYYDILPCHGFGKYGMVLVLLVVATSHA